LKAARAALVVALLAAVPIVIATGSGAFAPNSSGELQRVSLSSTGGQLATGATQPAISGNGRYVAFTTPENSAASNDTNNSNDVYVRDTIAGTTTLISKFENTTNGAAGDDSSQAALSNDGRWVAFTSKSTKWAGTPFTTTGVFVVDRGVPALDGSFPAAPGAPVLVSIAPGATTSVAGAADSPSISADGSQIAFHFVTGGANRTILRDRDRNHNGLIADSAGDEASIDVSNGAPDRNSPNISADGRHVVFVATDPAVSSGAPRVVVYDRSVDARPDLDQAGNTRFAVVTTTAFSLTDGDGNPRPDPLLGTKSATPSISSDGNVVAYAYAHPMKTPTPSGRLPNATFEIIAVHRDANGAPINPIVASADGSEALDTGAGDQDSLRPVLSADGHYVDFPSSATNFGFANDQGASCGTVVAVKRCDIFAVDLTAPGPTRAPVLTSQAIFDGNKRSFEVAISATGQFSALTSDATDLVPSNGDTNNAPDVFLKEWQASLRASSTPSPLPDTPVGATSGPFIVSVDTENFGPWSAAQVTLAGVNPGDFTVDPQSCTTQVFHIGQPCAVAIMFHPAGTGLRNANLVVTLAGHAVEQDSLLVQGTSGVPLSPGVTERVSLGPLGTAGVGPTGQINANSSSPGAISSNGRYVTFVTDAKLNPSDNNGVNDVYVRDRLRGTTTLVSATPGGSAPNGPPTPSSSISGDGRYIAVSTVASLTTNPADAHPNRPAIYVLDRGAPNANGDFTGTPVMHLVAAPVGAAACDPDISGDGSQIAFSTLTPAPAVPPAAITCDGFNTTQRAFVVDEDTNNNGLPFEAGDSTQTELTPPGGTGSTTPRISADGLHVVFEASTALTATDPPPTAPEAWAYDRRITGSGPKDGVGNTRYTVVTSNAFTSLRPGDNRINALQNTTSSSPVVSGDGSVVAYAFHYNNPFQPGPADPVVKDSPLPEEDDQILFVRRDAAGNIVSSDIASEAGSNPPAIGSNNSFGPDISDDGRYVAFETRARNLLPNEPGECDGPCGVAVVVDIDAPGHAGAPQMLGPTADPSSPNGMPTDDEFGTSLSGDGRFAVFGSSGADLLPPGADTNKQTDVFLHELRPVDPPIPPNVDFGAVQVGNTSPTTSVQFTTNDFGPAPVLSLSLVGANPGDFNIAGTTGCAPTLPDQPAAPVAAVPNYAILHIDTPCIVAVNFSPTAFGTRTATLRFVTGTPFPATNPEGLAIPAGTPPSRITTDVQLVGGVGAPAFQVAPVPLNFGLQTLGQPTPDQPLTVTNLGGNPFAISAATLTGANPGDFTITSDLCSGVVLNPSATCVVRVAFHSTAAGDRSAFVQFVDTAGGSPHLAPVTGRSPSLVVNPGVVAPGRTVNVSGMSWLPGQTVVLTTVDTRDPSHVFPETRTVTANGAGNFDTVLVLFPKTTPGSRFVIATGLVPPLATANAPLLVAFATVQAPNFLTRG
jgi:Tol biopolymer transport system component